MLDVSGQSAVSAEPLTDPAVTKTVGTRIVAGLIFAQGLYYGLLQMWTAATLAGVVPEEIIATVGPFLAPGLQVLGVLIGGLVAGAGNPRGTIAGAAIGVVNAIAFALPALLVAKRSPDFLLLTSWLPLAVFGGAGGLLARQIFPSLFDLPDPIAAKAEKDAKAKKPSEPLQPMAWFRMLAGAALAVGCTVWAGPIRDWFIYYAAGTFILESRLQAQFVAWIISALAMIVGGAFAGATSSGGLKHGFLVGLLASAGIFVVHHQIVKEALPAEQFFANLFGLPDSGIPEAAQTVVFLLTNTLVLGTLSGWFGGALLPKVARKSTSPLDHAQI